MANVQISVSPPNVSSSTNEPVRIVNISKVHDHVDSDTRVTSDGQDFYSPGQVHGPKLEQILRVNMEKNLSVEEQRMVIQGICNDLGKAELLQTISDIVSLYLTKSGISDYVEEDFIIQSLNALEFLCAEGRLNILYLLAKSIAQSKSGYENYSLHPNSLSYNFIEMLLLSVFDETGKKDSLDRCTREIRSWVTEAKVENPKFLKYTNKVLFPTRKWKLKTDKTVNKIVLDTNVQDISEAKVVIQKPLNVLKDADLGLTVLSQAIETSMNVTEKQPTKEEITNVASERVLNEHSITSSTKKISKLRCKYCGVKFPNRIATRQHEQSKVCLRCTQCEMILENRDKWLLHILSHQNKNLFICQVCGKGFARKENLHRHVKSVHEGLKPHQCPICNNSFTEKTSLEEHLRIHTGEKPFMCDICQECFRTRGLFRRHVAFNHGNGLAKNLREEKEEKSFTCDTCGKTFPRKANLEKHVKTVHQGVKAFACVTCGKRFTEKASLDEHVRIHTGEKPFGCELCDEKFRTRSLYRRHIAFKHASENQTINMKPRIVKENIKVLQLKSDLGLVCLQCGKSFKRKFNLAHHIKSVHDGIKPYSCSVCTSSFSERKLLDDHVRIHTGEKPYSCDKCQEKFRTGEMFRKHIAQKHGFICPVCSVKFNNASSLNRHKKLQHIDKANMKTRFKCFQCPKTFMFRYQRDRHIQSIHRGIKNFSCETCGKKFASSAHMNEHLPVHSREPRFTCNHCGQGFIHRASYKRHVIRHLGLQQFPCPVCNKRFDSPDYAKNHVKRVHKDVQVQMLEFDMPGTSLPEHLRKRKNGGRKPNHELGSFNTSVPKIITNFIPSKGKVQASASCTESPKPRKLELTVPPVQEVVRLPQPIPKAPVTQAAHVQVVQHEILPPTPNARTLTATPQVIAQYDHTIPSTSHLNQASFQQAWGQYSHPQSVHVQHTTNLQQSPQQQQQQQQQQNIQLLQLENSGESRVINVPAGDIDIMQFHDNQIIIPRRVFDQGEL